MTRINVVPVKELVRQHLLAEYRELPRVFGLVRSYEQRGGTPEKLRPPQRYILGRGHVIFFYDKLLWLASRQSQLVNEMRRRGYNPQFVTDLRVSYSDIGECWWNNWQPDEEALRLNRERIRERLE